MCAFHLRYPSGQLTRLLRRNSVVVASSMGANKPQHRPVATAPTNQLEQALGAIELLGNLQEPTLAQPMPDRPVTGMLMLSTMPAGHHLATGFSGGMHSSSGLALARRLSCRILQQCQSSNDPSTPSNLKSLVLALFPAKLGVSLPASLPTCRAKCG
jgi:hypothetical protein